MFFWVVLIGVVVVAAGSGLSQPGPILTWITNSSVKLEQITGDVDWEAKAQGSNLLTASQTVTRFHILGNGLGYSFEDNGKLIFLFGDTISENTNIWNYHAADPLAWSTNMDGESPLLLNFFTNSPITNALTQFTPLFVQPADIKMGPDDVPNAGISLSNGVFIICNTRSDLTNINIPPQTNDESVLVTFKETGLLAATNTYVTNFFTTNRVASMLNSNLDGKSPLQGRFINVSMHESGTKIMMFGTGEYPVRRCFSLHDSHGKFCQRCRHTLLHRPYQRPADLEQRGIKLRARGAGQPDERPGLAAR
jgi:hypothetical protein